MMNLCGVKFLSFNKIYLLLSIYFLCCLPADLTAQLAGSPGAFTRIGFDARGKGMGNAMTAVITGDVSSFYNPAATPFLDKHVISASYGVLSLDRIHNSLYYSQSIAPTAGFALGVLNSGVRNIDGRDNDGFPTSSYSTSENQFSFSFANRMSQNFSIGIGLKIYYYKLFDQVSSTSVGIDAGAMIRLLPQLTLGFAVQDINSKYTWETSKIYGQLGNTTTEHFPQLRKIGLSYIVGNGRGVISAEVENSDRGTTIFRGGAEFMAFDLLAIRAGVDHLDSKETDQAAPTFGFSLKPSTAAWTPAFNYAYTVEPYGLFSIHTFSLSTWF
jgi:hypothetical protein